MNIKDFFFKLHYWWKEHFLINPKVLKSQIILSYPIPEGYDDFVVHPCVRFIESGIDGYQWWMTFTPYKNYDSTKENILLYRAKCSHKRMPVGEWEFVKEVCTTHKSGFNSDPNLFYDGNKLFVIWREWGTENTNGDRLTCLMCSTTLGGINYSKPYSLVANGFNNDLLKNYFGDTIMCPCMVFFNDSISIFCSHYQYSPYLQPLGTSRYVLDKNGSFCFEDVSPAPNNLFDLWHFDMFVYDNSLFQIITGQFGNAIYIGKSIDGKNFKYSSRPLYSYPFYIKKNYFYKPSAQIINDKLLVFFPRKIGRGIVRIVMRSMDVKLLNTKFVYE